MHTLTYEQQGRVLQRVEYFVNLANEIYNSDLQMPCVRFDKRGTCGGTANYSSMELNFNAGLMLDNWDEYMNQVIPHEVAHLVKSHVYGTDRKGRLHSAHGYYWQSIMREFGCDPDRCHSMDVSKVKQVSRPKTKYVYACPCCGKEIIITSVRHNKIVRRGAQYFHCRQLPIEYVSELGQVTMQAAIEHKNQNTVPAPEQKKAAMNKKPKAPKGEPKKGTKIAHALMIYREMRKTTDNRQDIISAIANSMQIDRHRAAGYYQNCKKREA